MKKYTHYFCRLGYSTAISNKLQKAVRDYFEQLHGTLICKENLDELKANIFTIIESFNKEFPLCKPIKLYFEEDGPDGDCINIYGLSAVRFSLDKANLKVL